ncbi:MAG: type I-C CRISPR-associated protein Cas8c/Csd1 [Clostridiales bacterium]|nr:type I-C CRISPR-associated protein Cas8c/Csd1 [Clostridiales bacterium]
MGWMQKLCEAYDVGIVSDQRREKTPLVSVGFVRKSVKYHIILTMDGQFVSVDEPKEKRNENDKKVQSPILEIPSTPQAESRTGTQAAPYPLSEGLNYLVYEDERNRTRFEAYMEQLKAWCDQPDAPACLQAVYAYLDKHTLLSDLNTQPNLKVSYYKDSENHQGEGTDWKAMVCFSVQSQDMTSDDLWRRDDIKESWSRYYMQHLPGEEKLCYVEGKVLPVTTNYPKVQGNAKLISAKDATFPFKYKGRFTAAHSAARISTSAMIRAHNALSWLIKRQGLEEYDMTWVVWNTNGAKMRVPVDDANSFVYQLDDASDLAEKDEYDEYDDEYEYEDENSKPTVDTFDGYAEQVNQAALGYEYDLVRYDTERVNYVCILGLRKPTLTDGRLSISYYQECPGNDYVERLADWRLHCCWWGRYNPTTETREITTPVPTKIAIAVMGRNAVEIAQGKKKGGSKDTDPQETKRMRQLMSQLMMCIVDKQPLPPSLVNSAFYRCCNPLSFTGEKEKGWDRNGWNQSVNTTCALISCFQKRGSNEVFPPELQTASRNRDYLYGRLLAVADLMEEQVMKRQKDSSTDKPRPTNAIRLTQRFAQRPFDTWQMIHEKLLPTFQTAGEEAKRYQIAFEEIEGLFLENERVQKDPLSMAFLQGYSSQRQAWFTKREKGGNKPEEAMEPILYEVPTSRSQLYGCLLAIADRVELEASDGERLGSTNAMQMMPTFAARPHKSWGHLHDNLLPYLEKLREKSGYYQSLIGKVEAQFSQADRESTEPLDSSYLHGYYGMLRTFYRKTQYLWTPQPWQETAEDPRSLWYGRMLGAAEWLERRMLLIRAGGVPENVEQRATNALRYMAAFARQPATTWAYLKVKLQPYLRYGAERTAASTLMEQLEEQISQNGWDNNAPLNSSYLHGYYAERNRKGE